MILRQIYRGAIPTIGFEAPWYCVYALSNVSQKMDLGASSKFIYCIAIILHTITDIYCYVSLADGRNSFYGQAPNIITYVSPKFMYLGAHYFWGYKTVTAILIKNETLSYVYSKNYGNICDAEPSRLSNYDVSPKFMDLGATNTGKWKHTILKSAYSSNKFICKYCWFALTSSSYGLVEHYTITYVSFIMFVVYFFK